MGFDKNHKLKHYKLLFVLLLMGCAPFQSKIKRQRVWHKTDYEACVPNTPLDTVLSDDLIFRVNRTDLPFGRYDAASSRRVHLIKSDNSTIELSKNLINIDGQQGVSVSDWSPDGNTVLLSRGWEDSEYAMYQEITDGEGIVDDSKFTCDSVSYNLLTDETKVLSDVEKVSTCNSGGVFNVSNPSEIIFTAKVGGTVRPYSMNLDGTNKLALTSTSGHIYGVYYSPDGTHYMFHSDYKLYIGDAVTRVETQVNTGCKFNFLPLWSPNSQNIAFFCDSGIKVVDKDGNNLRNIFTRGGPFITVTMTDGLDYHGGMSDIHTWKDNNAIIVSDYFGNGIELFEVDINTSVRTRLTFSPDGAITTFPLVKNGNMVYSSKRSGKTDVFVMDLNTGVEQQVTDMLPGCLASYPKWRP